MTTVLYAQPYDLAASGFYFEDYDSYRAKATALRNDYGQPVEEFEIQFIDGVEIDGQLAEAICVNQGNLGQFFEAVEEWDDDQKMRVIIAVWECGYPLEADCDPESFDIELYPVEGMKDLAQQFVEDGLFGEIPEPLQFYIDYDAIARDLSVDYTETTIAGQTVVYRCG